MATAVLVPISAINLNGGVLPSSAITQHHSPRHGRSRGASISKGKGGRSRGYSLVDDRETAVSKAVVFVLKRAGTVPEEQEGEASDDDAGKIVADADGWVAVDDVLSHSKVSALGVTLDELKDLASSSSAAKTRQLSLRPTPATTTTYQIRRAPQAPTAQQAQTLEDKTAAWTRLTASTPDLPEFIVHETSYPKYHLILASGGIRRAGGQPHLAFSPAQDDDAARPPTSTADVAIWIHLRSALEARPEAVWHRTETGAVVTADEVPAALWRRAVARRGDLGVLFEDGEVRKEVPVGLRGKGAKARKGRGVLKSREAGGVEGVEESAEE